MPQERATRVPARATDADPTADPGHLRDLRLVVLDGRVAVDKR